MQNDTNTKPLLSRKRKIFRIFLYIFLLIIIFLGAGGTYLKLKFNDDYIKELITEALNKKLKTEVQINDLSTSWMDQKIKLSGIKIIPKSNPDYPILTVSEIKFNFDFLKSYKDKSIFSNILIDNLQLFVHRFTIYDKSTGEKKYTTNITESLNELIELPWKKWLSDVNWKQAGGTFQIVNSNIRINDDLKILDPCSISDINVSISGAREDVSSKISFKTLTNKDNVGTALINFDAILNKENEYNKNSKLGFLKNIKINSNLDNINLARYLEYFGIHRFNVKDLSLTLKDPVSLWLQVNSNTMKEVLLKSKLKSDSIGVVSIKNNFAEISPKITLDTSGKIDFSKTWSEVNPLILKLKLYNEKGKIFSANSQINGDFGDKITATVDAYSDLTAFSSSKIGKKLNLNIFGKINHSLALNWKRNGIWKINYSLNGEKVNTTINNKPVTLPVQGDINCIVTKSNILTPLKGSINFAFKIPFLSFKSIEPIKIDLTNKNKVLTTSIKYEANLGKIYDNFQGLFKSLKIGKISEEISGILSADTNGNIVCSFSAESSLKEHNDSPINVNAKFIRKSQNIYDVDVKALNKDDIQFFVNGTIEKSQNVYKAKVKQSGICNLASISKLKKRFYTIVGDFKLPSIDGNIREALNANINYQSLNNLSIASSIKSEIKGLDLNINECRIKKEQLNIEASLVFKQQTSSSSISFDSFNMKTPSSYINFSSEDYNLNSIDKNDWRKTLSNLPAISGDLSISKEEMTTIGELTKNDIADLYFKNAFLSGSFQTKGGAKSLITNLKYISTPIQVISHKNFVIDPILMANKIIDKKWFEIQKSLTDISATVSADLYTWKLFLPEIAVNTIAPFKFNAEYYQENDRLKVHDFTTTTPKHNNLLIPKIEFNGSVINFFKNIKAFKLKKFLLSIDKNLDISHVDVSISKIKELNKSFHGSNLRALQGKYITLKNISVSHDIGEKILSGTGSVTAKASYMSKSSVWPLLSINGTVSNYKTPLIFQIEPETITLKGSLDFTNSNIIFNALAPYRYLKPSDVPLKLEFYSSLDSNNTAKVRQASLVGGPLSVLLSKFTLEPVRNRFTLNAESIKLDGPFTVNISNLLMDSAGDRLKANIDVAPLDLFKLNQNFNQQIPFNVTGNINGAKIHIDDSYWKYFAPINTKTKVTRTPNNTAYIGSTSVTLSPSQSSDPKDSLSFAFSEGNADVSIDSLTLSNFTINNPYGFSNQKAINAKTVNILPDFKTLFSDQIIIDRININELNAYYEQGLTTNNFDVLKNNLQKIFSGSSKNSTLSRKTLIKDLYVTNGVVRLSSTILFGVASIPVPLDLHIQNIGGESTGETLATGISSIFTSIGKIGLKLAGSVGNVVGGVGKVGKSIITAPFKLFNHSDNDDTNKDQKE